MLMKHFPNSQLRRAPEENPSLLHWVDELAKQVDERIAQGQDKVILHRLLLEFRNHLKRVPEVVRAVTEAPVVVEQEVVEQEEVTEPQVPQFTPPPLPPQE